MLTAGLMLLMTGLQISMCVISSAPRQPLPWRAAGEVALHDRAYQRIHRPGALKASVAAALVTLAGVVPGARLLDPCCGTGTIAIEAAQRGAVAYGGDLAPEAIDASRIHATHAGVVARFAVMDARRLPFADGAMDCVVANLPGGRQVDAGPSLTLFYRRSVAEMQRVLAPAGRLVLLTGVPELVTASNLCCVQQLEISLYGQRPTILVYARREDESTALT